MTHIPRSIEADPALASAVVPPLKALLDQARGIFNATRLFLMLSSVEGLVCKLMSGLPLH